jgi:hypothetical protein
MSGTCSTHGIEKEYLKNYEDDLLLGCYAVSQKTAFFIITAVKTSNHKELFAMPKRKRLMKRPRHRWKSFI